MGRIYSKIVTLVSRFALPYQRYEMDSFTLSELAKGSITHILCRFPFLSYSYFVTQNYRGDPKIALVYFMIALTIALIDFAGYSIKGFIIHAPGNMVPSRVTGNNAPKITRIPHAGLWNMLKHEGGC